MKRRLFSLFLALTLVVGMLPAPAFAQETEPTQVTEAPTEAPATEAPATEVPATEAPATEAPAAEPTPAPTEALAPETTVAPAPTEAPTEPAPTEDEAVAAVQAMIDALPDVEDMSESYLDALVAAYSAFEALSETQQAQITGVEKLEALFGWVNSQVSTLADEVMEISGEVTWNNQTFTKPVKLAGDTTLTLVGDNKIECDVPLDLNNCKLTVKGTGSLELVGSNNDRNYYNSGTIYDSTWTGTGYTGGGMVIESGTVIAHADVNNAVAVRYLYMDGGKLEAYGARAGIVTTDLQIKDGSLYATGNSKCGINMYSAPRAVSVNGLDILVSNEPNAQEADMEDGTTSQIEDSKKTVAIGKFSTSPSISVQAQQGYLYEATAKTATFALSGRNVDLSALNLEWTGTHTGLTAEASADGKTLTVTTDKTVQAGTYGLKVSAGEASRTAVVTVSGPPICIYDRPVDTISTDPEAGEVHVSAYLTKGHTGSIDFQWKQEDGTPIEGYTGENVPLYDLVELGMLTQDESKPWLQSIRIYCTLSYDGYSLDTDTVTVGLNSCPHPAVDHEGNCLQCGQKKGDGDALLVREDGLYYLIANAEPGEANVGHFMYSGGNFYLTGDVPNKIVNVSCTDVGGKDVTLNLQGHTLNSLQMGNFPYGTFTLKNGTLNQCVYSTATEGKLILDGVTFMAAYATNNSYLDITVQGESVFKEKVSFSVVEGVVHLRGGTFEKGIDTSNGAQPLALLADGYAFRNDQGIVDASNPENLSGKIQVVAHTCKYVNGKCACGRSCDHQGTTDENGYCTNCGTFVYPFAIGEKLYTGLEAALTAAQDGDTVTLRGDYDMQAATVEIKKSITLELNGHTLSGWPYAPILTILAPDVTIQNGTVKNTDTSKSSPAVQVGTLHTTGAKLTVKNAIFEGSESHGTPRNYGLSIFAGNTAQAENGTFVGGISVNGSLTLNGGKADHIYVGTGVTYASLLAEGYAYQAKGQLVKPENMADGIAVEVVKCGHPDGLTATNKCPYCGMTCGHENINQTTGLCPECGYQMAASLTVNGKTTFFNTFSEAVPEANGKTGALLTLLKDEVMQGTSSLSFGGGKITVDWNGHTLSGQPDLWNSVIALYAAELTLRDSSGTNAGGIDNRNVEAILVLGGSLTIESGTYANRVLISSDTATVKISGGIFKNDGSSTYPSAIDAGGRYLAALMAPGYTLALDSEGRELYDVYANKATPDHTTVYVVPHAFHTFDKNGKCACGAGVPIQVDNGTDSFYFGDFESAVNQAKTLPGSTVRLLEDVTHSGDSSIYIDSGTFTIDWNGHTLSGETSNALLCITDAAKVTLTDSIGTGGLRNVGGAAIGAYVGSQGSLTIQGGVYSPQLWKDRIAYGPIRISGGRFENPEDSGRNGALYCYSGSLAELLAPGYTFAYEDDELFDVYQRKSDIYRTVYVVEHQHEFDDEGQCLCGYTCPHTEVDEAGDCILCGKQFYVRGTYADGTTHYYGTLSDALEDPAVTQAVIIRSFVPVCESWDGGDRSVTLDLNGIAVVVKSIQGGHLILRDSSGSDSILGMAEILKDGQVTLESGSVYPQGETLSVSGKLTVTGGYVDSLTAMEGSTVSLSGGSFDKIVGSGVTLRSLLAENRYYAELDGETPKDYADTDTVLEQVSVVLCDHTSVRETKQGHFLVYTCNCGKVTYLLTVTVGESDKKYFGDYNTGFAYAAKNNGVVRFLELNGTIEVNAQGMVTIDMENRSYSAYGRSLVIKSGSTVKLVGQGWQSSAPETGSGSSSGKLEYSEFIPVTVEAGGTFVLPAENQIGEPNMAKPTSLTVQSGGTAELQGGSTQWTDVYGTLKISGGSHLYIHQYEKGQLNITGGQIQLLQIYGDLPQNALSGGSYVTISVMEFRSGETEKFRDVTFADFQKMLVSGKVFQKKQDQSYPNEVEETPNYGTFNYVKELNNVNVTAAPFTGVQAICQLGNTVHSGSVNTTYGVQEENFYLKAQLLSPAAEGQRVSYQWYQVQDGSKTEVGKDATYTLNRSMNVGVYTYQVTASCNGYELTSDPFTVTVGKAPQIAEVEAYDETVSGKNDGYVTLKPQISAYEMRKPGEAFTACEGAGTKLPLPAGTYEIRMKETENYEASGIQTVTVRPGPKLTLTLPSPQTGYTLTASKTQLDWHEDVELSFQLDSVGAYKAADFGIWAEAGSGEKTKLTLGNDGAVKLTAPEKDITITVTGVKTDNVAPKASIRGRLRKDSGYYVKWEGFQENPADDFVNGDFVISAADRGSGVASIWYCLSQTPLTLAEMDTASWVSAPLTGTNQAKVPITENGVYYLYVKALDKANNAGYACTGKLVKESNPPTFSGVENGKTYYVTQQMEIHDDGMPDWYMTNGAIGVVPNGGNENPIKLQLPNNGSSYTFTVGDRCGNEATITVYMKPLSDLTQPLDSILEDTIRKSDRATLDDVEATLKGLDVTYATEPEKKEINDALARIAQLRQVLDQVAAVEAQIDALPDSVEPYQQTVEDTQIKPARDAYSDLTDHQKTLVDSTKLDKLVRLEAQLNAWTITEGDGQTWYKGSWNPLSFTVNGQTRKFSKVLLDGKMHITATPSFLAVSGSIDEPFTLTLKPEFLQVSMKPGEHTLTVIYGENNSGTGTVTFTVEIPANYLDVTGKPEFEGKTTVTVDGKEYPIEEMNGTRYVNLPETGDLLTIYSFKDGTPAGSYSNYPIGMQVFRITRQEGGAKAEEITEFANLLNYAGCSIRLTGTKGIRMITGISENARTALIGAQGLAGYTLEEYGTVVMRGVGTPTLENSNSHNFAYKKGKADPVFARVGGMLQYTNVLVGFSLEDCKDTLTLRPYIKLKDTTTGETVTLYGGCVSRSIGYIAKQNENTYKPGTAGYKYIHEIIDAVYGKTEQGGETK